MAPEAEDPTLAPAEAPATDATVARAADESVAPAADVSVAPAADESVAPADAAAGDQEADPGDRPGDIPFDQAVAEHENPALA